MAIPILNHLNFNSKSELQNAILHKTTSGAASDVRGKIIYDTGSDTLKYYSLPDGGSGAWVSLTAATSVTVSDNSGSTAMPVVFNDESNNLHDDTGTFTYKPSTGTVTATTFSGNLTGNVTGNASGTALTVTQAAQTAITSLGTLTALTVDNLGINGNTITANSGALNLTPASGSAIVLDGTVNVDAGVVTGATSITSTAFAGDLTGDVTGNADTATKIASITNSNIVQLTETQTLTNKTIAASQVTEISNITAGEGAQIENIDSTTISATQWGYLGAATGAITNTNTGADMTEGTLRTKLAAITESVTIGDATDVVTTTSGNLVVTGDLTVSGDTITANVGTLTVEDKNIVLNYASGSDTSSTANGSGITIQDAVDASNDATILWDATNDEFDFSHKITVPSVAGSLILDGNTISGIDDSDEFTDDDNHIMTSAAVQDKILGYGYTTDANVTHRPITAGGNTLANSENLAFTAGSNVTITESAGAVTIASTDTTTNTQLATAAALIDVSAMASNSVASFTHSLASQNLIVQMHDTTSGLVVHADVDHTSNNAIAITFANTGAELVTAGIGDIRVVVIDAVNGVTDKTVSYS